MARKGHSAKSYNNQRTPRQTILLSQSNETKWIVESSDISEHVHLLEDGIFS